MPVLLDTHVWVWSIDDAPRLTTTAMQAIEGSDVTLVSPITLFEICQKVRLGKWPEMVAHVGHLQEFLATQNIIIAPLSADVCTRAGLLDWSHGNSFDRMIAATALVTGAALISADTAFDAVAGLQRIWD